MTEASASVCLILATALDTLPKYCHKTLDVRRST